MNYYKNIYEFSGENAILIQKNINLCENVSFIIKTDISDLNSGELIDISIKMSGSAINSPYEIPYEDYSLEFIINNIKYTINNMLMIEWKEVYLYSYNFKFKASKIISIFNENPNSIEYLIPNLLISYDEMTIKSDIINTTSINISYKNSELKIIFEGNPEFNNNKTFTNNQLKNNISCRIIFFIDDNKFSIEDIDNIFESLIELISIAYGSFRTNIITRFYRNNILIGENLYSKKLNSSNKKLAIIPYQYSGVLSNFINQVFEYYISLTKNQQDEIRLLSNKVFDSISCIELKESLNILNNLSKEINLNDYSYKEVDYKYFYREINNLYRLLLTKLDYKGKYINWSNILPNIEDF